MGMVGTEGAVWWWGMEGSMQVRDGGSMQGEKLRGSCIVTGGRVWRGRPPPWLGDQPPSLLSPEGYPDVGFSVL